MVDTARFFLTELAIWNLLLGVATFLCGLLMGHWMWGQFKARVVEAKRELAEVEEEWRLQRDEFEEGMEKAKKTQEALEERILEMEGRQADWVATRQQEGRKQVGTEKVGEGRKSENSADCEEVEKLKSDELEEEKANIDGLESDVVVDEKIKKEAESDNFETNENDKVSEDKNEELEEKAAKKSEPLRPIRSVSQERARSEAKVGRVRKPSRSLGRKR